MKKYLPALICGFGAGILQITPIIKGFACCLIIPAAAILALVLHQKSTNNYTQIVPSQAIMFGLFTGLYAAVFASTTEIFITFVTRTNDIVSSLGDIKEYWSQFPEIGMLDESLKLVEQMAAEIKETGFSFLYTLMIFANNFILNPVFGMLGGLLGMKIINSGKFNNNEKS